MIRDRKMYVAPTPFGLVSGLAHLQTLILPQEFEVTDDFQRVSTLIRKEADELIIGYTFDLKGNTLVPETISNPSAGREHVFVAWRLETVLGEPVAMREDISLSVEVDENDIEQ